eukprot:14263011-Alexandrium_andersonii.AAC.1
MLRASGWCCHYGAPQPALGAPRFDAPVSAAALLAWSAGGRIGERAQHACIQGVNPGARGSR